MLASLLIVFREVLEAGLIVGIVLAATQGISHRGRYIVIGIGAGVLGAGVLALFAGAITESLSGFGEEIFNSAILLVAVVMLGWHTLWMASHGREIAAEMKALGRAVTRGESSLPAMATVVAVAVLREGSEVVLFLYGIAASGQTSSLSMLAGGVLGVLAGSLVSWLLYRGLVIIPLNKLFDFTSGLIALLAAGMAGRAAAILAGADLIPAWGYEWWDSSSIVADGSMTGRVLQALLGYSDRPMGVQLAAWAVTLATLIIGRWLIRQRPAAATIH
ncbi:FTR1 family iron permease [Pseudomonas gingeri]|uniref:FTR1 family protein n=1 Tax=Pseudomonas gingeri TaxID=117681 RepID=A0A7Y7YDF3_9PSED|nr:FTR1 family protein [Pseudomonas gingeri]NWB29111.1 FTR1 family protein [Pseudomonas gingeri]NWC34436.1 FTR1 family protein [Pseudomonas gingeri]